MFPLVAANLRNRNPDRLWYHPHIPDTPPSLEELIRACASGTDTPCWELFVREFRPLIAATIVKAIGGFSSRSSEEIDDLIQETFFRVLSTGALRQFRSSEPKSIYGLLQAVAFSVVQDHFRKSGAQKRGGKARVVSLDTSIQVHNPNDVPALEQNLLVNEIEEILAQIAPKARDQLVFKLHHRDGLSAKAIASLEIVGLSQKGVESLLQRLLDELRRRLVDNVTTKAGMGGQNPS